MLEKRLLLLFAGVSAGLLLTSCGGEAEIQCIGGDTLCGASCVDVDNDPRHCGGCDTACGSGELCVAGACATSCPTGQSVCDGACYDTQSSAAHCGACGTACAATEQCVAGACVTACPAGQTDCSGTCVDTQASRDHCGACGTACASGEVCGAGSCALQCPDGQAACSGGCFDLDSSAAHCGDCGSACASGEVCTAGACEANCPTGQTQCNGLCVSTDTDSAYCGDCNTACASGEACVLGACVASCGGTLIECSGACKDAMVDRNNCGGCGVACAADEACESGSCVASCGPGQTDCNGNCTSTLTDEANCGACGTACGANELCTAGSCTLTCAGNVPNECSGVCTNVLVDPANCGGCGTACVSGESCLNGGCVSNCGTLTDCNGSCTNTNNDPLNCGGCGATCTAPGGAVGACVAGGCAFVCSPGQGDCDGDLQSSGGNGCETNLMTSANDCGVCGTACTFANATGACTTGQCGIGTCDTGFDDCDTNPANGCETELAVDPLNCNMCGNACGVGFACSGGTCLPAGETGEDCTGPLVLTAGVNTKPWGASSNDYLTAVPSCTPSSYLPDGPDVVLMYSATFNGFVDFSMDKATSTRFSMSITDAMCGTVTPELACVSEFTAATMGFGLQVTANTDYFLYLVDTTSGTGVLPNPIVMTVTETNCAAPTPVTVSNLNPTRNSTTTDLVPSFEVTFSSAVDETVGIVTVSGNMGTALSYDLSTSPTQVSFDSTSTVMTVDPGVQLPPGEVLTVSWSGIIDVICSAAVAPPSPPYVVNVIVPPCVPGANGMVGSNVTVVPTGGASFSEYYVSADESPTGWVYAGGLSNLYRYRKDGTVVEDLEDPTRLGTLASTVLGYTALYDGNSLYTMDSATGTTLPVNNRLWRLTNDGGNTWALQDMAQWSTTAPEDDFRAMAAYGGRIYMLTHEGSSTVNNEIWSIDPNAGTLPTEAVFEGSFGGGYSCSGLAVDMNYYYVACGSPTAEPILRVDRTTLAVTQIASGFDLSGTVNVLYGDDFNGDGVYDYLYLQGWYEEGYFICDPTTTPYMGNHFQFNTGSTSNYGMGFDTTNNVLWMIDDGNRDLIQVQ